MKRILRDIDITDIEIPKSIQKKVDIDREDVNKILSSLREDGQQQPALVMPPTEPGGRYRLVFGQKRFVLLKKLGKTTIRCEVDERMTESEAITAGIAENLFRMPGPKSTTAYQKQLRLWWEEHQARNEGKTDRQVATVAQKQTQTAGGTRFTKRVDDEESRNCISAVTGGAAHESDEIEESDEETLDQTPQPAAGPKPNGKPKPFVKHIQETMGVSARKAAYDAAVARAFTVDQIDILVDQNNCGQKDLELLSKLPTPDAIEMAVRSIIIGETVEDAYRDALVVHESLSGQAKQKDEKDLSNAAWLEEKCFTLRPKIANTAAYDRDAILYRKVRDGLRVFKAGNGSTIGESARSLKQFSPFAKLMAQVVSLKHPDEWLECGTCQGACHNPAKPDEWCPECRGCGFKLAFQGGK